jgi:hypothetical protein
MARPSPKATATPRLIDLHPAPADLRALVLQGMDRQPRQLPAWLLYDAEGSRLFEAICEQPEYSLTRTEVELLQTRGTAIATAISTLSPSPPPQASGSQRRWCWSSAPAMPARPVRCWAP